MRVTRNIVLVSACAVSVGLSAAPASGQPVYDFVKIANNAPGGPIGQISTAPSINASNIVSFSAVAADNMSSAVLTGDGTALGGVASAAEKSFFFAFGNATAINDDSVAFYAGITGDEFIGSRGTGIFVHRDGLNTPIARANDRDNFESLTGGFSMNAGGTVAFAGTLKNGGGAGVFAGNGGPVTFIADNSGQFTNVFNSSPSINAAGTVAFVAGLDAGGSGIFTGNGGGGGGGAPNDIARTGPQFFSFLGDPSINDDGDVIFFAFTDGGNGAGIFTSSGGVLDTVATLDGPFSGFGQTPALNNDGDVAFLADLDAGGRGIFIGPDPVLDKVIRTGDPLFGSTVTDLGVYRGLNDDDRLAFAYLLANGVQGIAVVAVPEPGSLTLFGLAAPLLARRRRERSSASAE
jgi:hypothetical protein